MEQGIGQEFRLKGFLKFVFPTICTMILLSTYTIIDGIFISRFAGALALSATNIVYPVVYLILGISIMFSTGGSAVVSKTLGEGNQKEGCHIFTSITIVLFCIGIVVALLGIIFFRPIVFALGGTEKMYPYCRNYLFIMLCFAPISVLKTFFDYFLVAAGKPKLGLFSGILGGITNIMLDYVFLKIFHMGVGGAALATCIGMAASFSIGLTYFFRKKGSLYFVRPKFSAKIIKAVCINGSSEMVNQCAAGITTYLFNIMMLKYLGVEGVAAITIVLYAQFLLISIFLGFSSGMAPIVSYNYGSGNIVQLKRVVKYSYRMIIIFSITIFCYSQWIAPFLVGIFTRRDTSLFKVAVMGFRIFSISFLFNGFNIYFSGFFTALSNGKVSAMISFLRSLALFLPGIAILPLIWGVEGIWLVVPLAEFLTLGFCLYVYQKHRKEYGY